MAEYSDDESGIIRCICDLTHDDGFTIQCEKCLVWQHAVCLDIDEDEIPDEYLCEQCSPRELDFERAREIQLKKVANASKKSKAQKLKQQLERTKKTAKMATRNSSNAPSPNASGTVRPQRKKNNKRHEIDSVNENNSASPKPSNKTKDHFAYDSQAAEDLVNSICQVLHRTKASIRKRTMSIPGPLYIPNVKYLLSSSEGESDPKNVYVMDSDFLDSVQADVEVKRVSTRSSSKKAEGLFVQSKVSPGQFIVEVTGNVVLKSEYMDDPDNLYGVLGTCFPEVMLHTYLNLAVDCRFNSCPACHVRRNCTPNAELRSFFVSGVDTNVVHLGVFALQELDRGDEIFIPWTLSDDIFPDGLTENKEESSFRRSVTKAFSRNLEKLDYNITPAQAKVMLQTIKKDQCPCEKEPQCLINSFFKARRQFYSKQKILELAKGPLDEVFPNRDTTRTSIAKSTTSRSSKQVEEMFDDDSILSKMQSGSDTELDTSNATKPLFSANNAEEEASTTNSTLDVLDDPPQESQSKKSGSRKNSNPSKEKEYRPEQGPKNKKADSLKSKEAKTSSGGKKVNGLQYSSATAERIRILRTMSLTKYFIMKFRKENPDKFIPKRRKKTSQKQDSVEDIFNLDVDEKDRDLIFKSPKKSALNSKECELPITPSDKEIIPKIKDSPQDENVSVLSIDDPPRQSKESLLKASLVKSEYPPASFKSLENRMTYSNLPLSVSPKVKKILKEINSTKSISSKGLIKDSTPSKEDNNKLTPHKKKNKMSWQQFVIDEGPNTIRKSLNDQSNFNTSKAATPIEVDVDVQGLEEPNMDTLEASISSKPPKVYQAGNEPRDSSVTSSKKGNNGFHSRTKSNGEYPRESSVREASRSPSPSNPHSLQKITNSKTEEDPWGNTEIEIKPNDPIYRNKNRPNIGFNSNFDSNWGNSMDNNNNNETMHSSRLGPNNFNNYKGGNNNYRAQSRHLDKDNERHYANSYYKERYPPNNYENEWERKVDNNERENNNRELNHRYQKNNYNDNGTGVSGGGGYKDHRPRNSNNGSGWRGNPLREYNSPGGMGNTNTTNENHPYQGYRGNNHPNYHYKNNNYYNNNNRNNNQDGTEP